MESQQMARVTVRREEDRNGFCEAIGDRSERGKRSSWADGWIQDV